jgi:hypothetical protein
MIWILRHVKYFTGSPGVENGCTAGIAGTFGNACGKAPCRVVRGLAVFMVWRARGRCRVKRLSGACRPGEGQAARERRRGRGK